MTSRKRVEAALRHGGPDRTPIFEYVLSSPVADALLRRMYPDYDFLEEWGVDGYLEINVNLGLPKLMLP